jgi:hypothetical protein
MDRFVIKDTQLFPQLVAFGVWAQAGQVAYRAIKDVPAPTPGCAQTPRDTVHFVNGGVKPVHFGVNTGGQAGHPCADDQDLWFFAHAAKCLSISGNRFDYTWIPLIISTGQTTLWSSQKPTTYFNDDHIFVFSLSFEGLFMGTFFH